MRKIMILLVAMIVLVSTISFGINNVVTNIDVSDVENKLKYTISEDLNNDGAILLDLE